MKLGPVNAARLSLGTVLATAALLAWPSLSLAAGNVAAGKHLYTSNCAVCHKADGSGGVKLGPVTSPPLRAPALEKMYHNSDAQLRRAILDGKDEEGQALNAVMPRWRGHLTTTQANDVIAYLKTLR